MQFGMNPVSLTSGVSTDLCSWWCNLLGAVTLAHRYLLARLPTGSPQLGKVHLRFSERKAFGPFLTNPDSAP